MIVSNSKKAKGEKISRPVFPVVLPKTPMRHAIFIFILSVEKQQYAIIYQYNVPLKKNGSSGNAPF